MMIYVFGLTIMLAFWLNSKMRKSYAEHKKGIDEFLSDEVEANFSRKKSIEPEFFYIPNIAGLPVNNKVIELSEKKMLRFPERLGNTELKRRYGLANLEFITEYEENLQKYVRALLQLAEKFISEKDYTNGEAVLNECINAGSDLSKVYMLLADIYVQTDNKPKLESLKENVSSSHIFNDNELTRKKILDYIR